MHHSTRYLFQVTFLVPAYSYYQSHNGKQCPNHEVVAVEGMCHVAATELGLRYQYATRIDIYPAGCYFVGNDAYFNEQMFPDSVNSDFERIGGVCVIKGLSFILSFLGLMTRIYSKLKFINSIMLTTKHLFLQAV